MITAKDIGKLFQEARKLKGLSVHEAYQRSRIHPKVIEDIEAGVFDRLNKLYLKSFLKKYASFLGLNPEDMVKKFETISKKIPETEFDLSGLDKREKSEKKPEPTEPIFAKPQTSILKKPKLPKLKKPHIKIPEFKVPKLSIRKISLTKETMQTIIVVVLSIVLVVLVFVLMGMLKDRMVNGRPAKRTIAVSRTEKSAKSENKKLVKKEQPVAKIKTEKAPEKVSSKGIAEKVIDVFTKDSSNVNLSKVVLKLKARDKAWVQIKEGDSIIYDGIMETGESKTWESNGVLLIWTGKAGELEFNINTRKLGIIATGVVKNIKVSSKGIQIDDTWIEKI